MREGSLEGIPDLWKATYDLVAQVPLGKVTTYGEVARALGDVVASRFVGLAMSMNDDIVRVPCRRVVRSDGRVGGYTGGGEDKKIRLLLEEGVRVEGGKVVSLDKVMFTEFDTDRPLMALRSEQMRLKRRVRVLDDAADVAYVAGVDVAYAGERAFAASVTFDITTGEEVDRAVVEGQANFPYVPTYLAFRELPLVAPLIRGLERDAVLMYDGNGTLHPEGVGIASHVGVVFDLPTIGVAKSLLCGTRGELLREGVREILVGGRVVGFEFSRGGRVRSVFVSAGHRVSPSRALEVAQRLWVRRMPEPVRAAHMLAESARREATHK